MDYKTMAEIVKSRGDKILEERRIRRLRIRRITSGTAALCAAAVIGFGIWHSNTAKNSSSVEFGRDTAVTSAETTTVTAVNTTTAAVTTADGTSAVTAAKPHNDTAVTTSAAAVTAAAVASQDTHTTAAAGTSAGAPATVQTAAKTTAPGLTQTTVSASDAVTVTTTTEIITYTHRRVYYMNKLTAGFAAILVGATAMPKPVAAVNDTGMKKVPFELMSVQYDINDFDFLKWHNDESLIDIDRNGKFDEHDIYLLYRIEQGDTTLISDHIVPDPDDEKFNSGSLIQYFTCYYNVDRDILSPDHYAADRNRYVDEQYLNDEDAIAADKQYRQDFADLFRERTEDFSGLYDVFTAVMDEKKPDVDVDGSGTFDMCDVMDIWYFSKLFNEPPVTYEDMDSENLTFEDRLKVYDELTQDHLPCDSEEKCIDLYRTLGDDFLVVPIFSDYLIKYYFENNEFLPEYSDGNYYEYLWRSGYTYPDGYFLKKEQDLLSSFQSTIQDIEWKMGLPSSDVRADVDMTHIDRDYEIYKKKVDEGLLPEPDMNGDGRINAVDYYACDELYNNRYEPDPKFTQEDLEHYLSDFDINGNGISGDAADCSIAQVYICEKTGMKTKREKEYEGFRDAWVNGEVSNYPWPGTNCLEGTRYPLTDPDDLFSLCYNYVYAFTYPDSKELTVRLLDYYTSVEAGLRAVPDVDMNGVIDANDYIFAENTLYSQTHTNEDLHTVSDEIMDNYIANFDLDGSGVSGDAMDTLLVLEYVSRKCDIDKIDLEEMAMNARGQYTEKESTPAGTTTAPVPYSTVPTTTTAVARPAAAPKSEKTGDANCDTDVDLSDAILVMQALANPDKYEVDGYSKSHITNQGKINADVDKSTGGLTANDALCIQEFLLGKTGSLG